MHENAWAVLVQYAQFVRFVKLHKNRVENGEIFGIFQAWVYFNSKGGLAQDHRVCPRAHGIGRPVNSPLNLI